MEPNQGNLDDRAVVQDSFLVLQNGLSVDEDGMAADIVEVELIVVVQF